MKPTVIVINGYPRTGKDTFCEFAEEKYSTINHSTVDKIKEIAELMGWNGEKTPENRNMLSGLKDFYDQWFDGSFKDITEMILDVAENNADEYSNGFFHYLVEFIFIHAREPRDIKRICAWCELEGFDHYTLCIIRDTDEEVKHGNHADANVNNIIYNSYIMNNGSLEEFQETTLAYLDSVMAGDLNYWVKYTEYSNGDIDKEEPMISADGVHAAHCCSAHGCKYNEVDCPVVSGAVEQYYSCEDCTD